MSLRAALAGLEKAVGTKGMSSKGVDSNHVMVGRPNLKRDDHRGIDGKRENQRRGPRRCDPQTSAFRWNLPIAKAVPGQLKRYRMLRRGSARA